MKNRLLGKTGMSLSVLGFGAKRFASCGEDVDEELAVQLMRWAFA